MEVVTKIPRAPAWFSKTAKKIYYTTTRELVAKHLLQSVGMPLIVAFCNQMALHLELEEKLTRRSRVIAIRNSVYNDDNNDDDENNKEDIKQGQIKSIIVSPYQKISFDALHAAQKLASEFGLTLSSQSRIAAPFVRRNNDEDNDFD